ncbi:MAG TPA: AsmA family protein [Burkholderiales bacterium]|nr:AsmA family protein [Burkholderiales bacterium]
MNKIIRYVVLPSAGIVVVVLALAAYLAATFDPNQYKPQIVQAVKDNTGRTLKLDGDIKLSFFPDIGATLGKASLSERASDTEFAGADDFHLVLKLLPLLKKQAVVDAIEATNLRATVIRYEDGKTNIDDLISGAKSASARGAGDSQVKVEIQHVTIKNATITYFDRVEESQYVFSKLNLKSGRVANGVPNKIELSFTAQSDMPRLNLDTKLRTTFTFDLDQQNYALSGLDLSANGFAAGIRNLAASAKADIVATPASNEFQFSKLAIAATGTHESGTLDIRLDVPSFAVIHDETSAEKIVLEATLSQPKSKLAAKLEISGIHGNAKLFKASEFRAALEMQHGGGTNKATITSPLAGSIEADKIELPKLVATINVRNPKLPKNPLDATISGTALVELVKQNATLIFATKVDDSNIRGKAGLAKFARPFYTFDIDIDQLDLDRYLPKPDPKQPFDLSALKGLNARGSVKIGALKMGNVKASNARFDVNPADGRGNAGSATRFLPMDSFGARFRG